MANIFSKIRKKCFSLWIFGAIIFLSLLTLCLTLYIIFLFYFRFSFFPGVYIGNLPAGGQTPAEISATLSSSFQRQTNSTVSFRYQENSYTIRLKETLPELNLEDSLKQALLYGRSGNYLTDLKDQLKALRQGKNFYPQISFRRQALLDAQLQNINQEIMTKPINAGITLADLSITPSQDGHELDQPKLLENIKDYLLLGKTLPTDLPVKTTKPTLSTNTAEYYQSLLAKIKDQPVKLHSPQKDWLIDQAIFYSLLNFEQTTADNIIDQAKLKSFLDDIAGEIYIPTQEARFNFDSSNKRVNLFQPAIEGKQLNQLQLTSSINQALPEGDFSVIDLPIKITKPQSTTEDVNSFGIKELLGEGVSFFTGSITNRIYNIGLAASRLNGSLTPPGKTFSFNDTVGDISAATGYKQAYVIKSGRTVLDDGGGVCQVSTTLFRSILNSGLPITERAAHAYRVGYYEQGGYPPGLDATVYAPSTDFKFKNNTPAYVLVQAKVMGNSLVVDLYGTSDGRVSTLTKPIIQNQTPPPPELRQDDPTLPKGEIKQVDWPAWGANVSFSRTVERNGDILIKETWRSNFKPWQAVYLIGTKQ